MTFWLLGAFTDEYGIRQASLILTIWSTCPTELVNIVRRYGDGSGTPVCPTVRWFEGRMNCRSFTFFCPFTASETKWCHSDSQHWHLTSLLAVPASLPGRYQSEFCRSKCLSFGWAWASKMQFVTSKEYLNVSHSAMGNILFIIPLLKILDVWHRAQRGIKYVHT